MKSKIVLAAAFALLPAFSQAQTVPPGPSECVKGTLASYIALGAVGCVFDNAVYSNFTYSTPVVSGAASTTSITAAEVLVTPFLLPTATMFPGLNFSALPATATTGSWSVAAGKTAEFVIGYLVTPTVAVCGCPAEPAGGTGTCVCPPIAVTSAPLTLDLGASRVSGIIGSVTVQENATEFLPPTGGSAPVPITVATLEVYDTCDEVCRILQTDTVTISPLVPLQTNIIVTLEGGTGGASLNGFASDLAIGPQPE
jgi:hypothetical protein